MQWHKKLALASVAVMAVAASPSARAQSPHIIAPPDQVIAVSAGHLFDAKSGDMLTNQVVLISGDRVTDVGANLPDSRRRQGDRPERGDRAARHDRRPCPREHRRRTRRRSAP